jgi:hypothetical protein
VTRSRVPGRVVRDAGADEFVTFDLGNWGCLDVDPNQAAQKLGWYVVYLHYLNTDRGET